MLFGAAAPATAAVVSHAVTPAVANGVRYQLEGSAQGSGQVLFGCQTRARNIARPFCYGPDQIRAAYGIQPVLDSGITGAGRTIVIIDAFQSPTIQQDLALFDQTWGYPAPTFNIIAPDGLTPFNPNDAGQVSWSSEISLDVQWAHVVAPGATIDLVLAKSNQDADILSVTRYAVEHNLGDVISQSFGEAEACMDPALLRQQHKVFREATEKGITLFASSGDSGSGQPTCDGSSLFQSASTPASDPNVTGVGGTSLLADAVTGAYGSETVWNDDFGATGGGYSTVYKRPGYQAPFNKNNKQRGVPDVAYNGDVRGGVIAFWGVPFGVGAGFIFGGTSAGSPQWGGIVALADQKAGHRLGAINRDLYHIAKSDSYGSAFHDVTTGDNACTLVSCGMVIPGFSAGTGWDAASGLGTPNAANLISLLSGENDNQQGDN
jgi:subtilase family serine protease